MKLLSLIFLIGIMSVALLGCSSCDVGPIGTPDSTKGLTRMAHF